MECIKGKAIADGIAIGKLTIYANDKQQIQREKIESPETEKQRYYSARNQAVTDLRQLYQKAIRQVGKLNAQIFETHAMLLENIDYNDSVINIIETKAVNAEYAVMETGNKFSELFASMDDDCFRAKSIDIKDISQRVIAILTGAHTHPSLGEPIIVAAKEFTPSQTIQINKEKLLAFITEQGSFNSHTAILARSLELPAITGIAARPEWNGKMVGVDGDSGTLYLEPDQKTLAMLYKKQEEKRKKKALLQTLKERESITKSGRKIKLYSNIGSVGDLANALANGAEGIGLFRTEFLYLEAGHFPTEQEQFLAYKAAAETMTGKKVVIRTLDIGADKQAGYFDLQKEENPAMGYRGIRICLERRDIFKTQLRAIARASAFGNIAVMFPMITSMEEVVAAKTLLAEVKTELDTEGLSHKPMEIGIMIETPSAAIMSDELANEVDFFSIGTNDLTQYTLAMDRQNSKLGSLYNPRHPAVLRLIKQIIKNAHTAGIWVGICGELAADLSLTHTFVNMGVDELSVTPHMILPVRQEILKI